MKRLSIVVSGRVQGVGYRYFTRESAETRGITGWVRNRWDGRVELEAQGSEEVMDEFVRMLEKGQAMASVAAVDKKEIPCVNDESGFGVEY